MTFQPVLKPNFTDGNSLQVKWKTSPFACGRPPADLTVPIICTTAAGDTVDPWIIDQGTDFAMQSHCCPTAYSGEKTLVVFNGPGYSFFSARTGCSANYCYLSDENTAHNFSSCIEDASRALVQKGKKEGTLRNNATTPREFNGTCEYIDYDMLKKGAEMSGQTKVGDAPPLRIWSLKAVVSIVGLSLFVIGSGVI